MTTPGNSKEELLYQLLQKENSYYSSILEITQEENKKLASLNSMKEISPLLEQKKDILASINQIEERILPLKKLWESTPNRNDQLSLKIKEELTKLNKLLGQILQLDIIGQKNLEGYLESLRKQIKAKGAPE